VIPQHPLKANALETVSERSLKEVGRIVIWRQDLYDSRRSKKRRLRDPPAVHPPGDCYLLTNVELNELAQVCFDACCDLCFQGGRLSRTTAPQVGTKTIALASCDWATCVSRVCSVS